MKTKEGVDRNGQASHVRTKRHRCNSCGQVTDDSAGLPSLNSALGVLWLLPEGFTKAYEELFHKALSDKQGGVGGKDPDAQRSAKPRRDGKLQAGPPKKFKADSWIIRSDKAFERKKYVDRQLRKLARWITSTAMEGEELVTKCPSGCGAMTDASQNFCSKCGTNLRG